MVVNAFKSFLKCLLPRETVPDHLRETQCLSVVLHALYGVLLFAVSQPDGLTLLLYCLCVPTRL